MAQLGLMHMRKHVEIRYSVFMFTSVSLVSLPHAMRAWARDTSTRDKIIDILLHVFM